LDGYVSRIDEKRDQYDASPDAKKAGQKTSNTTYTEECETVGQAEFLIRKIRSHVAMDHENPKGQIKTGGIRNASRSTQS
jgi:hypothetical protein